MCKACRLWSISFLGVLLLTIFNISLTIWRIHSKYDCHPIQQFNELNNPTVSSLATTIGTNDLTKPTPCIEYVIQNSIPSNDNQSHELLFGNLNFKLGRYDTKRVYKIFDNAAVGNQFTTLSSKYSVCLATLGSLERLMTLPQIVLHWTGPISLGIFAADTEELYLIEYYLMYLRFCFPAIKENINIHLIIPGNHTIKSQIQLNDLKFDKIKCKNPDHVLSKLVKSRSINLIRWRTRHVFPQNHIRNVARKGCQTENVFLIDIDIIPCANFTNRLDEFIRNVKCPINKCAYVVPTYEIDIRAVYPKDKNDLVRLVSKQLARPFHHQVFIYNQFATNNTRWEKDLVDQNRVHVSYNVTNFEFLYEPFYVANDMVPPHDERFLGYGFTRNTQVYEMFVSGYLFQVITPLFACHWGLQTKKTRPQWREAQNNANRKQLDDFKREVYVRYQRDPLNIAAKDFQKFFETKKKKHSR